VLYESVGIAVCVSVVGMAFLSYSSMKFNPILFLFVYAQHLNCGYISHCMSDSI
jgi:hypothetical protein